MADIFKCGLCKEKNRVSMTRKGLRNHLKKEHRIMSEITNKELSSGKLENQRWWIKEEKDG